jgi:hypothetical protein
MAFAIVALSAVNLGIVMRRERESPLSSPVFPYLGWIMLGWALTWAAAELNMLQRLLDTVSLTDGQWLTVIGLSIVAPAAVGIDKAIQLFRQNEARDAVAAAPLIARAPHLLRAPPWDRNVGGAYALRIGDTSRTAEHSRATTIRSRYHRDWPPAKAISCRRSTSPSITPTRCTPICRYRPPALHHPANRGRR